MTDALTPAGIIRVLGRGKKGSRNLTADEAHFMMQSILDGSITEAQLGAFLMLMRVKEETPEELAGMIRASAEHLNYRPSQAIDVNWPAYAGKKKQPSWYVLSALLLAQNGVKVLLHGGGKHTAGRQYAEDVCRALNIGVASNLAEAENLIKQSNIAYIAAADFSPALSDIIDMKAELGLRSPVNTLIRHLNPLSAKLTLQGMFHPAYMPLHHETAVLLGQLNNIVLKGDGGEFEVRPDSNTAIAIYNDSPTMTGNHIPPVLKQRSIRPDQVTMQPLLELWRGEAEHPYGEAAVIQTAALVYGQLMSLDWSVATRRVEEFWQAR